MSTRVPILPTIQSYCIIIIMVVDVTISECALYLLMLNPR
jgi:hypothetical protein